MNNLDRLGQKVTLTLLLTRSLFSASTIMAFTVSSIILLELVNNDSRWAGVPGTLNLIGAALMAYPIARLMDRAGRRVGLSIGHLFGLVGAALTGWAVIQQSLSLFLPGILLLGFTKGAVDFDRYAAGEANSLRRRARAISLVVFGGTAGSIIGPSLVKWTTDTAASAGLPNLSGPWFLIVIFFMISLLLVNLFLRPDPQVIARQLDPSASEKARLAEAKRPLPKILKNPAIKLAIASAVCGQLVMVLIMSITPVHMHLAHHQLGAISLVIMAHTLGMFGLSFVTGWLIDKWGRTKMIMAGSFILVLACLVAPLSTQVPVLATGLFLLGLGWNFCYVAGSALLADHLRLAEKGQVQGINDTLISLSAGIGSLGSGLVFAEIGFAAMNWLGLLFALIPAGLIIFFQTTRQTIPAKGTV
jgi:MFS family permease